MSDGIGIAKWVGEVVRGASAANQTSLTSLPFVAMAIFIDVSMCSIYASQLAQPGM